VRAHFGRWRAQISYDGCTHHLGTFGTKEQAAAAFDRAARQHRGGRADCPPIEWSFVDQQAFLVGVKELESGEQRKDAIQKELIRLQVTTSTTVHLMTALKKKRKGAPLESTAKKMCKGVDKLRSVMEDMARRKFKRRIKVFADPAEQEEENVR
jgi:hypothetical protein